MNLINNTSLQYFQHCVFRCFVLIENSSATDISEQDNLMTDSMNVQEGMIGMGMESTLQTVFMQCSPQIFKVG